MERHLLPEYRRALDRIGLPPEFRVLDLAMGTGLLAGAFSERGRAVSGLDFADKLLTRARRRFSQVDFHHYILRESARIARAQVLIFDYGCNGGWFVRFIEWVEGPNDPAVIAEALLGNGDYAVAYRRFGRAFPHAGYGGSFYRWLFREGAGPYGSWGNGAAMRVSFALNSVDGVLAEAARSAAVTHDHPEGIKGRPGHGARGVPRLLRCRQGNHQSRDRRPLRL